MRNLIFFLIVLLISCKESLEEPTVPIKECKDEKINEVNKRTSHYNPYFVPFINYWLISGISPSNCTDITGRTFLNINNNKIPDLIITITNGCGFEKGKAFVFIDNVLRWSFQDPQILTRKIARGDLNNDGFDDVVLFGHGHDGPPYPGDKNYIIYFTPTTYEIVELDPQSAYHHTGAIGDINNDGKLDIIPIANQYKDGYAFLNNGDRTFRKKKIFNANEVDIAFHLELFDFNGDGNLDCIIGGHEWMDYPSHNPNTRIIFGDGKGDFNTSDSIILPAVNGWGVITDFDMHDLDQDGNVEIIITRTAGSLGTGSSGPKKNPNGFYDDFRIQVLKKDGDKYIQSQLLSSPSGWENASYQWVNWVSLKDIDGDCKLDIVVDSERLNLPFNDLKPFYKLFYKGDGKGGFSIAYKS